MKKLIFKVCSFIGPLLLVSTIAIADNKYIYQGAKSIPGTTSIITNPSYAQNSTTEQMITSSDGNYSFTCKTQASDGSVEMTKDELLSYNNTQCQTLIQSISPGASVKRTGIAGNTFYTYCGFTISTLGAQPGQFYYQSYTFFCLYKIKQQNSL